MNKYEFFIAFTAIVCGCWVLKSAFEARRHRWRAKQMEKKQASDQTDNEDAAANLRAMEERIRVLEKIITDRQSDLRDRFRDLEKE